LTNNVPVLLIYCFRFRSAFVSRSNLPAKLKMFSSCELFSTFHHEPRYRNWTFTWFKVNHCAKYQWSFLIESCWDRQTDTHSQPTAWHGGQSGRWKRRANCWSFWPKLWYQH